MAVTTCLVRKKDIVEVVRVVDIEIEESFNRDLLDKIDTASGWLARDDERI